MNCSEFYFGVQICLWRSRHFYSYARNMCMYNYNVCFGLAYLDLDDIWKKCLTKYYNPSRLHWATIIIMVDTITIVYQSGSYSYLARFFVSNYFIIIEVCIRFKIIFWTSSKFFSQCSYGFTFTYFRFILHLLSVTTIHEYHLSKSKFISYS